MPTEAPGTTPFAVAAPDVALITTLAPTRTEGHLHKQLRFSIALSAVRCMLTYVVVPVLSPLVQPSFGHDPRVAIPLSVTALIFDGRALRTIWRSDLRWRLAVIAGYAVLVAGITVLVIGDIWRLVD
jgi:hypothetical protein